ncbi:hypothetical protein LCGC14_0498470 [marine sediment metagenome]|uniref:Dehydrogenase E1 component domain-containing protein n=1 Tax=marine sediment metagenome TaxID=412755 RepID=A0A0F9VD62_9ZZZZ
MTTTKQDLIDFEAEIAELFEVGKIKAPVHLSGGNEDALIRIFQQVKPDDWVFSTHRSHHHALLKGIPREWLKAEIIAGHSITLNNAEYHFFTSAIVGGILPIAVGVAMTGQRVWCFVGDMAAETGVFNECLKYARGHGLPIKFVVEDNGLSVQTPTREVWGSVPSVVDEDEYYQYNPTWPHQSTGKNVIF